MDKNNCFDCLLSAYEYVGLLEETLNQVLADIEKKPKSKDEDIERYFQVVKHNLSQCERHISAGKRCLNNLRRLEKIG